VFGETITNYSKMPLRRLELVIPVHYDVDVKKIKTLINEIVGRDSRIAKESAPFFRLTEYGASSLNFTLRVWTKVGDFWSVKFDLLETILEELRAKNIEIPYNQLDVHVVQSKEA
jgi:small conductance mechanosensitive channel